uniref:RING-type domain-containing protein n=1 Tax=Terrapene triunguis TaxID=2587831 RepID=A0A674JNZ8_9SAUR
RCFKGPGAPLSSRTAGSQFGWAMTAGDLAGSFQDKVNCSVCLEYFKDPVTIECGHNFCRACISQCWGESEPNFSCPQCRETAPQRNLQPNRQLGNVLECYFTVTARRLNAVKYCTYM